MNNISAQLISITDEIEREKQSHMDNLISSLASLILQENSSGNENISTDTDIPSTQHEENMLCLLCLRIKIIGQIIEAGNRDYVAQLSEDINTIIENTKRIEHRYTLTDETLDHTWDLLMAICPEHEKLLSPYFRNHYKNKLRRPTPFTPDLYFFFTSTTQAYERLGKKDYSISVLENLCQLSKERNEREIHQEIIARILVLIGDRSPEATIHIAQLNLKYFKYYQNIFAGDFYWFYACALQQLGKKTDAAIFLKNAMRSERSFSAKIVGLQQ